MVCPSQLECMLQRAVTNRSKGVGSGHGSPIRTANRNVVGRFGHRRVVAYVMTSSRRAIVDGDQVYGIRRTERAKAAVINRSALSVRNKVGYTETSLIGAYLVVVRYLNRVGLAARDPFRCPLAAEYRA